jgi:lipid-A-disaccharide synthase
LAVALRQLAPNMRLIGAGGGAMREAGVEVVFDTTDHSIVGLPDSFSIIPSLLKVYRSLRKMVESNPPDLVVLIDNESMNMLFARWLHRRAIPVVFFFPPQIWFWGRWRLRLIVPIARRILSAFRQEAELYSAAGTDTVWVGHPLRDVVEVNENPAASMRKIGLDPGRPMVALMPGSRQQEIRSLAGPILGAARMLQERDPRLQFALPLAGESLRADVEARVRESGVRNIAVYRPTSYAVLSQAQVVLQCSGTATLEAALLGIPSVIVYRCLPVAYMVGKRLMRVKYIGMVNILLDDMVQPEFFQKNVDARHLADEVWSLLSDQVRRRAIQTRLAALPALLGPPGVLMRAAQSVAELLPNAKLHAARFRPQPEGRVVGSRVAGERVSRI